MTNLAPHPDGDVSGEAALQDWTAFVGDLRAIVLGLGAGVAAFAAPGAVFEAELFDLIGH